MLIGGLLIGTTSGVLAEELMPVLDGTEGIEVEQQQEGTLQTSRLNVYPEEYPEGFNMYQIDASVDGEGACDLVRRMNVLRESEGLQPLVLDKRLVDSAMHRAAELSLVYRHKDPAGGWGQSEYDKCSGAEVIVIGRDTGRDAYEAFEGSGGHHAQMIQRYWTKVGVGNYGGAWVLSFYDKTLYKSRDMTETELIDTYTTDSRIDKIILDSETYNVTFVADKFYNTSKTIKMDKGTSKQMGAYVLADPYSILSSCSGGEVQAVPSTVTWVSSNPSIASIDENGVVTGLKAGTVVVTGTLFEDTITYSITVEDDGVTPNVPEDIGSDYLVKYRTHVQNVGWQDYVSDKAMSGTQGRCLRLEGINIDLADDVSGGIEYRTHVQNVGWQDFVANDAMSGTQGRSLRLEGIDIRLTGEVATKYDIYYRTHVQNFGWMGWAKNGESSGSAGYAYRLEGINVVLVEKGGVAPGYTGNAFMERVR